MKKPEMILFDYGRTLLYEPDWDAERGDQALFQYITCNPNHCTAEDFRRESEAVFGELDRITEVLHYDVPCATGTRLILEHLGIQLSLTPLEQEIVFWSAATPGAVVPYADTLLDYLNAAGIRTGVISNNGWSGEALKERMDRLLPNNRFEFVLSSCDYLVRKPDRRLFEVGLQKAQLPGSKVWYCGDSIRADVYGAKNAGMFPVFFDGKIEIGNSFDHRNDGLTIDFAHLHIHDWRELIGVLEAL
ncbi:MAG: HAD family hydrolase [Faecousia sp.]